MEGETPVEIRIAYNARRPPDQNAYNGHAYTSSAYSAMGSGPPAHAGYMHPFDDRYAWMSGLHAGAPKDVPKPFSQRGFSTLLPGGQNTLAAREQGGQTTDVSRDFNPDSFVAPPDSEHDAQSSLGRLSSCGAALMALGQDSYFPEVVRKRYQDSELQFSDGGHDCTACAGDSPPSCSDAPYTPGPRSCGVRLCHPPEPAIPLLRGVVHSAVADERAAASSHAGGLRSYAGNGMGDYAGMVDPADAIRHGHFSII